MGENGIAKALRGTGIVLGILGLIGGLWLRYEWDELLGIAAIATGAVNCVLFLGLGEIIKLLQTLVDMKPADSTPVAPSVTHDDLPDL